MKKDKNWTKIFKPRTGSVDKNAKPYETCREKGPCLEASDHLDVPLCGNAKLVL